MTKAKLMVSLLAAVIAVSLLQSVAGHHRSSMADSDGTRETQLPDSTPAGERTAIKSLSVYVSCADSGNEGQVAVIVTLVNTGSSAIEVFIPGLVGPVFVGRDDVIESRPGHRVERHSGAPVFAGPAPTGEDGAKWVKLSPGCGTSRCIVVNKAILAHISQISGWYKIPHKQEDGHAELGPETVSAKPIVAPFGPGAKAE